MSESLRDGRLVVMIELFDPLTSPAAAAAPRVLRRIVCGVNGTSQAREAIRQAAELAGPAGTVEVVTVTPAIGGFPSHESAAATALFEAQRTADGLDIETEPRRVPAATAAAGLIRTAAGAGLLVIGCDALGPTPKAALRRAPCSVLLARRPPDLPLLDSILVASEAGPASAVAEELAREHGAELRTAPVAEIPTAAAAMGCGLIVIDDGATAVQVARLAPCSVLVVRGHS